MKYIAVEGPIGVGKTSLARLLAAEFNGRLVLEEVEENPFLARFYEDADKYALPVQLYFLLTRYNQQRDALPAGTFTQTTVYGLSLRQGPQLRGAESGARRTGPLRQRLPPARRADGEAGTGGFHVGAESTCWPNGCASVIAISSAISAWNTSNAISAAYRDFFFYTTRPRCWWSETSAIDFVADSNDLRDLIREIERAGQGTQHFVPRKG